MESHGMKTPIHGFEVKLLPDPRSPTIGINRTPIQVLVENDESVDDVEMDEPGKPILDKSPVSSSMNEGEGSPVSEYVSISSDNDADNGYMSSDSPVEVCGFTTGSSDEEMALSENIEIQEKVEDRVPTKIAATISLESTDENLPATFSYPKYLIKKTYTPANKMGRNPLENVQNVMFPSTPPSRYATQSPQFVLRQKQWRRFQDERERMGLVTDENTVPPMADLTASAPGKLSKKFRSNLP